MRWKIWSLRLLLHLFNTDLSSSSFDGSWNRYNSCRGLCNSRSNSGTKDLSSSLFHGSWTWYIRCTAPCHFCNDLSSSLSMVAGPDIQIAMGCATFQPPLGHQNCVIGQFMVIDFDTKGALTRAAFQAFCWCKNLNSSSFEGSRIEYQSCTWAPASFQTCSGTRTWVVVYCMVTELDSDVIAQYRLWSARTSIE